MILQHPLKNPDCENISMYKFLIALCLLISCSNNKSNEKGTVQVKKTSEDASVFTKMLLDFAQHNDFPGLRAFALSKGYQVTDSTPERHMENKGVNWISVDMVTNNSLICFLDDSGLAILDFVTYDESFSKAMKDHLRTLGFKYSSKQDPEYGDMELFEQEHTSIEIINQKTSEGIKSIFSFMLFE